MCLLIAMFQVVPDAPLIVAANRDERLDRPAVAMTVLREQGPRILGGRDELAGGTWLAVNEHGLVAGLTNQPSANGRDPTKRSRGELPLAFAVHASASEAVGAVRDELDPAAYNPCWMLVGDRRSLYSIGISGGSDIDVEQLSPGVHVLENAPLREESAKATFVLALVGDALARRRADDAAETIVALQTVLADHRPAVPEPRTDPAGRVWPPSLSAACVQAEGYGTRSAMIVSVSGRVTEHAVPRVLVADGPPCETPMREATDLWATARR